MTQQSIIKTNDELEAYLAGLNESGVDTAVIIEASGMPWLAYCTDPDADWYIESGNPRDRMIYENDEQWYKPLDLTWLADSRGPFVVIDQRQAGHGYA